MTVTKFCSSCQSHRKIEGGIVKVGHKRNRWVCAECTKAAEDRKPKLMAAFAPKKLEPLWRFV